MNPFVGGGYMGALSPRTRNKLCSHKPQCKKFVTANVVGDGDMFCEVDARLLVEAIIANLGDSKQPGKGAWTQSEEDYIVEVYTTAKLTPTGKLPPGTMIKMAKDLGKTKSALDKKVRRMKKAGKL